MSEKDIEKIIEKIEPSVQMHLINKGIKIGLVEAPKHETAPETKEMFKEFESKMVTKEVFELMFKDLKDLIELKFDNNEKGHRAIETQTKLTNGRVTKLERWQVKLIAVGSTLSVLFTAAISIIGLFN